MPILDNVLFAASPPSPDVLRLIASAWEIWLLGGAILGARAAAYLWHRRRLRLAGIEAISMMTGEQFEHRLAVLFRDLGYRVEHTGKRGDFGADLVITKGKKRTVVQAKRWSRNVGPRAVQEAHTARSMYGATAALVVTSGDFTRAARKLAAAAGVALWGRPELVRELLRAHGK